MSLRPVDIDRARDAVLEAGRIAMRYFRQRHERWEKAPGQIVTEADIAIDRFLHGALRAGADAAWLSEETEDDPARLAAARVWVVDPIDGTRSFADGIAEFTISVALLEDGAPQLGFVLNPATGELLEARRGHGATLNGRPVEVRTAGGLDGATIVCSRAESRRRNFAGLLPRSEVTSIGSLALKLALVAAGRFDGYLTWRRTHDWDIAAACLLIAEAGGRITDAAGAPLALNRPEPRHQGIVAAAPALHAALLEATAAPYAAMLARPAAPGA